MNEIKRNIFILIGLVLCFTGIFMYKIESSARKYRSYLNEETYKETPKNKDEIEDTTFNNQNIEDIEKTENTEIEDNENVSKDLIDEQQNDSDIKDELETNDNSFTSIYSYQKNSDWNLILVNANNKIEKDREVLLENVGNFQVDYRIANDLKNMIDNAKFEGVSLIIRSAYRSYETQKVLYNAEVKEWMDLGYNQLDAMKFAAQVVAVPGTSEHQLGLAIDFVTEGYNVLDEKFEETKAFKWLEENAHLYGFIMRYPTGKTEITGIQYEPWHFRYIGKEIATYLRTTGLTVEEFFGEPLNKVK